MVSANSMPIIVNFSYPKSSYSSQVLNETTRPSLTSGCSDRYPQVYIVQLNSSCLRCMRTVIREPVSLRFHWFKPRYQSEFCKPIRLQFICKSAWEKVALAFQTHYYIRMLTRLPSTISLYYVTDTRTVAKRHINICKLKVSMYDAICLTK